MQYQTLSLNMEPPAARLTLDLGAGEHRMGLRTLLELRDACERIEATTDTALLVVRAEGEDFCRGWEASAETAFANGEVAPDPFGCLARLPCPVVAILHGRVAGAGLALALACDVRVARDDATFELSDAAGGSLALAGAGARLPRIAGRSTAASMLLLGTVLDADEARRTGLTSRTLPRDQFQTESEALMERIVANGPIALRYAKELVQNGIELPLDQALRYELDLSIILQTTHDRAEGVQAFLEKRPPNFQNR